MGQTELPSILCGEHVYYSVPELFNFLEIKNDVSNNFQRVRGFLQNQEDKFLIDETTLQIKYKNKTYTLDSADIIRTRTNLFLRSDYFEKVFGLQNEYQARNLAATLLPDFDLPAVKAAKREQMQDNLKKLHGEISADTLITRDHPLFHLGTAAWSFNSNQRTDNLYSNRFNVGLGGLLAGGDFIGSISYNSSLDFSAQNLFYQWRHVNNQNPFLRQVNLGKITSPSKATIFHSVVGAQITNAPTYLKKSFGTYRLNDYTNSDWVVELYINNVLVDYTQADASGFFSFNVPLTYGHTEVSLRYYGPWGEEETSIKHYNIPFNFMAPGDFQYTLSSGMVEDEEGSTFLQGTANYGITDKVTIGGGIEYLSSIEKNKIIPFLNTSVRFPANMLLSGEYLHQVGYKGNFSFTSPSSLRVDLTYKKFREEQMAVQFSYLEERTARFSVPINLGKFRGTSRLNFQQNLLRNSSHTFLEWLLSGNIKGFRLHLTNMAFLNNSNRPLVYSRLATTIRLPKQFIFSPQLEYEYLQNKMTSFQGELRKRFNKINLLASYSHNFKFDQSYLNVGLNFDLGFTRVNLNSSHNKRYTSFSQSAGGGVLIGSSQELWKFDHRPTIGRGGLRFKPFLDINGNGKRDLNEMSLEGVNIHIRGGAMREIMPGGVTEFTGLEPYISYYFDLDPRNLQNIAWQIDQESMEVYVNPNQIKVIEIPVKIVGEVAGFVRLGTEGLGGIRINFFDRNDVLVSTTLSAPDGFFSYMGLKSGLYTAKIEKAQVEKLNLGYPDPIDFKILNNANGDYVDHLTFVMQEIP